MTPLYELNKENWDKLAMTGFPSVAEMAKHFTLCTELGAAIGVGGGAVSKWARGQSRPTKMFEGRAADWLNSKTPYAPLTIAPIPTPAQPTAPAVPDVVMLLVVCPSAAAAKAQKILGFLGCEVTEV
ncbi:hypothetical protein UFOVP233_49 [uncultured Caudovirales phage]|uniref:Uncharacterized protein n=1 Tax=uncultured Caudovirales phage TaxID=2100421 RepID=A0A6J7WRC4_9CAUD|nr:hypothetical protein UFOVP233_49 [uncultured Caudovirales phage]